MLYTVLVLDSARCELVLSYCYFRLDEMGALRRKFLADYHQKWRLFTFPILHAGYIHIVINLCSMVYIGVHLEQKYGPCKFLFAL